MEACVLGMADRIVSRGPDDRGAWVDAETGVALGFRRLSILDLSPAGHQPMEAASGRWVIAFNGEIYNFRELRAELEALGARWRGHSDTEVILAGVERWGVDATVRKLWGMFAIALWDREERALHLVRDRLGKKPLYYAQLPSGIVFGSEMKALRAYPGFDTTIDRDALGSYLRFGYVPSPRSIYRGTRKLPQGTIGTLREGKAIEIRAYWDARAVVLEATRARRRWRDEEAIDELDALLRDAVGRRMVADVPLGAFLSGGIDSSAVVALMQAQSTRPVKTFSIGFDIPGYNEAVHAKAVAEHLGTEHTELYLQPSDALDVIPRLPTLYDEPFSDSSQIPTFLVSELARRSVTVALSGDGGDELFSGYTRYALAQQIWGQVSWIPGPLRRTTGRAIAGMRPSALAAMYGAIEPLLPMRLRGRARFADRVHLFGRVLRGSPEALYSGLVTQWNDPSTLLGGRVDASSPIEDPTLARDFPDYAERMMYLDLVTYLPDDILVKVDRASMGCSLEARAPLLDHRVAELAWRFPMSLKVRDGQSKWVLRRVLDRYVPRALIERPKMGFGIPIDEWLRGPLKEWAEELIAPDRLRREGYLDPAPVQSAWKQHQDGTARMHYPLWTILSFQAWLEAWSG